MCIRDSCKEAQEAGLEEEAQIQKYLQAVDIYKGDFLPKSSFEEWVVPVSTYYHTLYLNAVHRLLDPVSYTHLVAQLSAGLWELDENLGLLFGLFQRCPGFQKGLLLPQKEGDKLGGSFLVPGHRLIKHCLLYTSYQQMVMLR